MKHFSQTGKWKIISSKANYESNIISLEWSSVNCIINLIITIHYEEFELNNAWLALWRLLDLFDQQPKKLCIVKFQGGYKLPTVSIPYIIEIC